MHLRRGVPWYAGMCVLLATVISIVLVLALYTFQCTFCVWAAMHFISALYYFTLESCDLLCTMSLLWARESYDAFGQSRATEY